MGKIEGRIEFSDIWLGALFWALVGGMWGGIMVLIILVANDPTLISRLVELL